MKPEKQQEQEKESKREESAFAEAPADKADSVIELTDEEKLVLNLLKENSPVDLNELKGKTGLSNKKWDSSIKGLRGHNLVKVEKNDAGLFVMLTQ